ncbi:MAG: hypothetical protein PSX36_12690 [bacterium]|nr:hypothetical protein [bacterium]
MRNTIVILFFISKTAVCQIAIPSTKTADSLFQSQNWKKAKQAYEAVLTDTTINALAWNRLAYSNFNLKLNSDAIICYKKAISQNPVPGLKPVIYLRLSRVLAITNDTKNALIALDSAVACGYSNTKELDTLSEFKKLRKMDEFIKLEKKAYLNANPCMLNKQAREFDFWVGEWDVFVTNTKQYVGHSLIQIISGGCAILENWESPNSNGKSINFIDPVTNKWKQSWAGNYADGIQEFANGEYKDDAMRFTFESTDAKGLKTIGRFMFFNQGVNQVRQFNETSVDGGNTWTTNYDFTYIRKK